jgi:two-component system cell cycle response regulator DivK
VVEDDEPSMKVAVGILEQRGCSVLTATTAEDGLRIAYDEIPDLILMDISLPGMDGLTAVRILKQKPVTRQIPVLVLTAHALSEDEDKALAAGCDAFLTKPINMAQFHKTLTLLLPPKKAAALQSESPSASE